MVLDKSSDSAIEDHNDSANDDHSESNDIKYTNSYCSTDSSDLSSIWDSDDSSDEYCSNEDIVPNAVSIARDFGTMGLNTPLCTWNRQRGSMRICHCDVCDCTEFTFDGMCERMKLLEALGCEVRTFSSSEIEGVMTEYNVDAIYLLLLHAGMQRRVVPDKYMPISDVSMNLYHPVWKIDGMMTTPSTVLRSGGAGTADMIRHWERIVRADLSCPILVILLELTDDVCHFKIVDGYHRLAKAKMEGVGQLPVKILTRFDLIECPTEIFTHFDMALISTMVNRIFAKNRHDQLQAL